MPVILSQMVQQNINGKNTINTKEQQSRCGEMLTNDDCRDDEANDWYW